jgi:hypothetical protein
VLIFREHLRVAMARYHTARIATLSAALSLHSERQLSFNMSDTSWNSNNEPPKRRRYWLEFMTRKNRQASNTYVVITSMGVIPKTKHRDLRMI